MLIEYQPKVMERIREIREICKAEQPEIDCIDPEIERILMNMFITTADEYGIARFEQELGIVPVPGQNLEERRIAVLVRVIRKNLNFQDILNLIYNYSNEIELKPDYDAEELLIKVNDSIDNVLAIYKTLDDILGLNIYIYFVYEIMIFLEMLEMPKILEMETFILQHFLKECVTETELETCIKNSEIFESDFITKQHNLWYLDGSVSMDGSRIMDAEEIKEEM
ncbi:MAG: DUF2313 domain-containing protein [Lachnospiraceae bacterium]|nr:DUF2313 domain-containing protein [Lachnospiraceae bacterium]